MKAGFQLEQNQTHVTPCRFTSAFRVKIFFFFLWTKNVNILFLGTELVDWLTVHLSLPRESRGPPMKVAQRLLSVGVIEAVNAGENLLEDSSEILYRFGEDF